MILYQVTHQKDISALEVIKTLEFKDNIFGQEILNFNVTNPGIGHYFFMELKNDNTL